MVAILKRGFTNSADAAGHIGGLTMPFFKRIIEEGSPFAKEFLKPKVLELRPGQLKVKIPFREEFIGNIGMPCWHGGTISAVIDHCGGFCAWSVLTESSKTVSTVDFRADFLRPALREEMICDAHVVHRGGKIIRVDVVCWDATHSKQVAIGRVTCKVYSSPWRPEEVFKHLSAEDSSNVFIN